VGAKYVPRFWLLPVYSWIRVDGEQVAGKTFSTADGRELTARFEDSAEVAHQVRVEFGSVDTWRGRIPVAVFVDEEQIARTEINLGKQEASAMRTVLVILLVLVLCGLVLFATGVF
jgi:hypothetical protein